jgi:hypothetical protein
LQIKKVLPVLFANPSKAWFVQIRANTGPTRNLIDDFNIVDITSEGDQIIFDRLADTLGYRDENLLGAVGGRGVSRSASSVSLSR